VIVVKRGVQLDFDPELKMKCETKQIKTNIASASEFPTRNVSHALLPKTQLVLCAGPFERTCEMLTQERLKQVLRYNPDNGVFIWLIKPGKKYPIGMIAGYKRIQSHGGKYLAITIDGIKYGAHRLAFLYMVGTFPKMIDHKDRDGFNNSWSNLRECTPAQNAYNCNPHKKTVSGCRGVNHHKRDGRWVARISFHKDGKTVSKRLGSFDTKEKAIAARIKAEKRYHGEYAPIRKVGTK